MASKPTTSKRSSRQKSAAASKPHKGTAKTDIKSEATDYVMPNAFRMTASILRMLWQHKVVFGALAALYAVLTLVLVQGVSSATNVTNLKHSLDGLFGGQFSSITSSVTVFVVILGSSSSAGSNGWLQAMVAIIMSLAIIWTLRQVMAGNRATLKSSLYKGMSPLIPFLLVLIVIGVQLLPLLIGSTLYGAAMNGVAIAAWEKIGWAIVYILFGLWTGYMLSASIFALYIVTLPDMTPLAALRSARQLVKGRRWLVVRKVLVLPLILLFTYLIVVLPVIMIAVAIAPFVFFALTCLTVVFIHAYMYGLYRELINEQG